VRASR